MTPAEELRAAAKVMREFAGLAQHSLTRIQDGQQESVEVTTMAAASIAAAGFPGAEHIASWRPAAALAVADWLEQRAAEYDDYADGPYGAAGAAFVAGDAGGEMDPAIAVARAYLGSTSREATP